MTDFALPVRVARAPFRPELVCLIDAHGKTSLCMWEDPDMAQAEAETVNAGGELTPRYFAEGYSAGGGWPAMGFVVDRSVVPALARKMTKSARSAATLTKKMNAAASEPWVRPRQRTSQERYAALVAWSKTTKLQDTTDFTTTRRGRTAA